ncbi:MAG: DNA methyltransferase [Chloroflexi bacterium]|nr:DNA methyltransferase [Chloroflexota bacterium]
MNPDSPNTLYYGDNLPILRTYFPSASVDLIYLDPPFNSNRSYNVLFKDESGRDSEAQITAFEDSWHWGRSTEELYSELLREAPERVARVLAALVESLGRTNQICAYLVMMTARLIELHRVLKASGSLYLHCDDSASHYLKLILDSIFGPENYRNHLNWKRSIAHNDPRRFGRIQDHILFYSRTGQPYWNGHDIATAKTEEQLAAAYPSQDERGRYRADNLTGPLHNAERGSPSTLPWRKYDVYALGRCWSVPKTGKYAEYIERHFIPGYRAILGVHERLEALDAAGLIHHPKRGKWPGLKRYAAADTGNSPQDLLLEPSGFTNYNKQRGEHLGFQTQKPRALVEKFIRASCPPDGFVLDPFCGCGTAIDAAHALGRRWAGIDITHLSVALMKYRLRDRYQLLPGRDYQVIGEPTSLPSARQLAAEDRYQFQWWALSLVGAKPLGAPSGSRRGKRGADRGIDGVIHFLGDGGAAERALIQVKSGGVNSGDIRDLRGTLERENAALAAFITLEAPSQPMQTEALAAGFYETEAWGRFPRLQVLTIEDLLAGATLEMPREHGTFRRAPRAEKARADQGELRLG